MVDKTLNITLTERQIVDLSKSDFSNISNSLDIVDWHLEQMLNNGFDRQYFNAIRQNLKTGMKLTTK